MRAAKCATGSSAASGSTKVSMRSGARRNTAFTNDAEPRWPYFLARSTDELAAA